MKNYSPTDVERLAERVRLRMEQEERYARETQEAIDAKKSLRLHEIIIDVVVSTFGRIVQHVVEQIQQLLS